MSTFKPRKGSPSDESSNNPGPRDPWRRVTDIILEHLRKGVVPWRRPWSRETGSPCNFHSGKPYRGVNVILLGCRPAPSPWWMTYRQALERGGQVRKGETGAMVIKYGTFERPEENPDAKVRKAMFLRAFTVFNAVQIDGIAFPESPPAASLSPEQRIAGAEAIAVSMPQRPVIREGAALRACYSPSADEVHMPPFAAFESPESYYATLYHELAHATGHPARLNRPSLAGHDGFGGKIYSLEELVAEMCAAFVCMEADIVRDRHERSAAYLKGWLSVLGARDHSRWIVRAAGQAARAADFILGRPENPGDAPAGDPEESGCDP